MPRSTCEVVSDILETVKDEENCKITKIIKLANLDWNMSERYINYLLENNYLESYKDNSKGKKSYKVTKKGKELLKSVNNVKGVCEDLG